MATKLKKSYKNEEDIPEDSKHLYDKTDDGWLFGGLEDEPDPPGGKDKEDTEAKTKLKEFRENNIRMRNELNELKTQLAQFKGIDPERHRKAEQALSKIEAEEERNLIQEGRLDEVIKRRTAAAITAKEEQLKAKDTALANAQQEGKKLRDKLGKVLIGETIQVELSRQGLRVRKGALPDVLARTHSVYRIDENGEPVPFGEDGKILYGESGEKLKMSEFAKTHLLQGAKHLFEPATGGDAGGGSDAPPRDGVIRIKRDDLAAKGKHLEDLAKGKVQLVD